MFSQRKHIIWAGFRFANVLRFERKNTDSRENRCMINI